MHLHCKMGKLCLTQLRDHRNDVFSTSMLYIFFLFTITVQVNRYDFCVEFIRPF